MEVRPPFHLGPISAWVFPVFGVLALALVGYLSRFFPTKAEVASLQEDLSKLDKHVRLAVEKQEEKAISRMEFNGFTSSMREKLEAIERRMTATEAKCESSYERASVAHNDVSNLTRRLEEVINSAIAELKNEVKELRRGRG